MRAVATRHNLNVHDVSVQDLHGRLHVEQHLEMDEKLSLKQAHDVVSKLESEIRDDIPEIASILTHIERVSFQRLSVAGEQIERDARLEERLKAGPGILGMAWTLTTSKLSASRGECTSPATAPFPMTCRFPKCTMCQPRSRLDSSRKPRSCSAC